jgi:ABC-type molybdenum transport system ATPase subunit/photorepair protein PhrA
MGLSSQCAESEVKYASEIKLRDIIHPMLKRLYIDNFRSFVGFTYRPESKQLLMGANGSGKSSLLDAIRAVKRLLKGVENPFLDSTRTRWLDKPLQVFEIELVLDGNVYSYRLENRFSKDSPISKVYAEKLTVNKEIVFEHIDGKVHTLTGQDASSMLPLKTTQSSLQLAALSSKSVDRFLEWIKRVHCLYIDAYPDAMSDTSDTEDALPDDELENLADWYRHLAQADFQAVLNATASLRDVLDGFNSLQLEQIGANSRILRASFTQADKPVTYLLSELSPGQRQLIALYLILHALIARGETVFLDEPTAHVSLREIQPWLLEAERATEDHQAQLILISHHPELLNQWSIDYGILFSRESGGEVRSSRFTGDPEGFLRPAELVARGWENE